MLTLSGIQVALLFSSRLLPERWNARDPGGRAEFREILKEILQGKTGEYLR